MAQRIQSEENDEESIKIEAENNLFRVRSQTGSDPKPNKYAYLLLIVL